MWLKKFELAIIERDIPKIDELLSSNVTFENVGDMQRATYLIEEALKLVHEFKNQTKVAMVQMKKNIDFLKATEEKAPSKLDIRS